MPNLVRISAAQYLRMSSESQQFSFANQENAISRYAEQNGFVVIKSYSDPGRSGLRIRNRPGLWPTSAANASGFLLTAFIERASHNFLGPALSRREVRKTSPVNTHPDPRAESPLEMACGNCLACFQVAKGL
jgi:hypothetical protein